MRRASRTSTALTVRRLRSARQWVRAVPRPTTIAVGVAADPVDPVLAADQAAVKADSRHQTRKQKCPDSKSGHFSLWQL